MTTTVITCIHITHYLVKSEAVSFSRCAAVSTMVTLLIKKATERKYALTCCVAVATPSLVPKNRMEGEELREGEKRRIERRKEEDNRREIKNNKTELKRKKSSRQDIIIRKRRKGEDKTEKEKRQDRRRKKKMTRRVNIGEH